jgi:hypothetical protein
MVEQTGGNRTGHTEIYSDAYSRKGKAYGAMHGFSGLLLILRTLCASRATTLPQLGANAQNTRTAPAQDTVSRYCNPDCVQHIDAFYGVSMSR